jgi:hypothetical protein
MVVGGYFINGLMVKLLMVVGGYAINGCWWLCY